MKNLIKTTLDKIQKQEIKPKSKIYFYSKNILLWFLFFITFLFATLAIALIIFFILDLDWDIYQHLNDSYIENLLIAIPHLWLILMLIFSLTSIYIFKKTKKAYKKNIILFISLTFLLSIISAIFLYQTGLSQDINNIFEKNIPQYTQITHNKTDQWSQANKGLLSGTIQQTNNYSINILDFSNKNWSIKITPQTIVKGKVLLEINEQIKIIGEKINKNEFQAKEIRPWGKQGNH